MEYLMSIIKVLLLLSEIRTVKYWKCQAFHIWEILNVYDYVYSFVVNRAIPIQWVIDQADEMHVYTEHSSGRLNILFKSLLRLRFSRVPSAHNVHSERSHTLGKDQEWAKRSKNYWELKLWDLYWIFKWMNADSSGSTS